MVIRRKLSLNLTSCNNPNVIDETLALEVLNEVKNNPLYSTAFSNTKTEKLTKKKKMKFNPMQKLCVWECM